MFTYFHQHKFRYQRGQIAPLMILVLVIILIMSLVTVNLYKVAMDKTYSANAVDAGALAAGSAMANLFNALASSNAGMETGYKLSYISISLSIIIAEVYLGLAIAANSASMGFAAIAEGKTHATPFQASLAAVLATIETGKAIAALGSAQTAITGLMVAVTALYAAQQYFYGKLRQTAIKGRQNAMEIGHKFVFYNSSIGSRLPEDKPVDSSWSKSRKDFSRFIDDISVKKHYSVAESYEFDWVDGQNRQHTAESKVATQELDTFDLVITVLPYPAVLAMLLSCSTMVSGVIAVMNVQLDVYAVGGILAVAEGAKNCCQNCSFPPVAAAACVIWGITSTVAAIMLACGLALGGSAIGMMGVTMGFLAVVEAGLMPGVSIRDSNHGFIASNAIICWIDNIVHNRRFRTDFVLTQQGADLGLLKTDYPSVHSFSEVDFTGGGQIRPTPVLNFDPSIIKTDNIGKSE